MDQSTEVDHDFRDGQDNGMEEVEEVNAGSAVEEESQGSQLDEYRT